MQDSEKDMKKYILEKFREKGSYVDIKAREVFTGRCTKAQLNCCLGHNPCRERERLINDCKGIECPRCGMKEYWNHVLSCPCNLKKNEAFIKNMRIEIEKIKTDDVACKEDIVANIKDFLNRNDRRRTMQRILGINMIFWGFIVKNWHEENTDCNTYLS